MRLTKEEKEQLLDLLDVVTDRYPEIGIKRFVNEHCKHIFYGIFKKVRFELKGY